MKPIPFAALMFSAALAGASELFYTDEYNGSVFRLDTETGVATEILDGTAIPHRTITGPNGGLAFRTRSELLVSSEGQFNGEPAVVRFHFDGTALRLLSTRAANASLNSVEGLVRGPGHTIHGANGWQQAVATFGADVWMKNNEGVWTNRGPAAANAATLPHEFPEFIAWSAIDGRMAVGYYGGRVSILGQENGSWTVERTITLPGGDSATGVAFAREGLPLEGGDGGEAAESSLLLVGTRDADHVLRYVAATGEPHGADAANRADPIYLPKGSAGIMDLGNLIVDPADGHLYVENKNQGYSDKGGNVWVISRFDEAGGVVDDAVHQLGSTFPLRYMAFRPRQQELVLEGDGPHAVGAGGLPLQADADLWLKAATEAQRQLAEYLGNSPLGEVTIAGDGSGALVLHVRDGGTVKAVKIRIGNAGELEVGTETTLDAADGIVLDGGSASVDTNGTLQAGLFFDETHGLTSILATNGGSVISAGGGNVISAGGGNVVSAGGGNVISAGGGNVISAGGGNIIAAAGGSVVSAGSGNFQARTRSTVSPQFHLGTGSLIVQSGGHLHAGEPHGVFASSGGSIDVQPGGSIHIDIGGTESGSTHDHYDLQNASTGSARLEGRLVVNVDPAFRSQITAADRFTVIRTGTPVQGTPENQLAGGRLPTADGSGTFELLQEDGGKSLTLTGYQANPPLEAWRFRHFTAAELADAAVSGDEADPNGNGLPNWAEFALDADPMDPSGAGLPRAVPGPEDAVAFRFTRRAGMTGTATAASAEDLAYRVVQSTDLENWTELSEAALASAPEVEPAADGQTETVTLVLPRDPAKPVRFLRLALERSAAD